MNAHMPAYVPFSLITEAISKTPFTCQLIAHPPNTENQMIAKTLGINQLMAK